MSCPKHSFVPDRAAEHPEYTCGRPVLGLLPCARRSRQTSHRSSPPAVRLPPPYEQQ